MRVQKVFLEKGLRIEGACDEGRIPGSGDDQRRSEYLAVLGPWAARATNSSEREIYNAGAPFKPAPASLKGHPSTESPLPRDTRTPQGVICVSRDVRER